jgi:hypothetical protein
VKEGKDGKRGIAMMFVRYPNDHESDSVRMWNRSTNCIVMTRDVIWLKRMFFTRPADDTLWDDDTDEVDMKKDISSLSLMAADDDNNDDETVKEEEAEEEQCQSKTVQWADDAEEATEESDVVTDELVTACDTGGR